MKTILGILIAFSLQTTAQAAAFGAGKKAVPSQQITAVDVQDLGYVTGAEYMTLLNQHQPQIAAAMECNDTKSTMNLGGLDLDLIINIGRSIWSIIQKGQPIIQESYNVATALPPGVKCWNELGRWKRPIMKKFEYKFFAGTSHTKLTLAVVAVTGGSKAGKGKYIAYASGFAESIKNWGFFNKLSINVEVPAVYNEGEEGDPVGAMLMTVKVSNDSPFVDRVEGKAIHISGAGLIELTEQDAKAETISN